MSFKTVRGGVSPGNKEQQQERLQKRLNAWATANLDPRRKFPNDRPKLRGRDKLIRKFGIRFVESIEKNSRIHQAKVYSNLRRVAELSPAKLPRDLRKDIGVQKQTVLFVRTKLHVARVVDSKGQKHWRSTITGRFVSPPHRKRQK